MLDIFFLYDIVIDILKNLYGVAYNFCFIYIFVFLVLCTEHMAKTQTFFSFSVYSAESLNQGIYWGWFCINSIIIYVKTNFNGLCANK